jgi:protein involved in polysaccharide export with SLBB domain
MAGMLGCSANLRFGGVDLFVNGAKATGISLVAVIFSLLATVVGFGCASEHRISLAEFLAARQTFESAPPVPNIDATVVQQLDHQLGPYRVGAGDELQVQLTGRDGVILFPALPVRVDRAGRIDLPLVGKIAIGDLELEDAEAAILQAYVPAVFREAICYIGVQRADLTNVLVLGAVLEPGLVSLSRHQRNMLYAIVGARGASQEASGRATLRRLRGPQQELTFDLSDPNDLRAALMLDPLDDGDIIHVQAAQPNTVFVGGLVNRPAPQNYIPGSRISVLQAIAAAGGLRTDVTPTEGTLVRRQQDGSDAMVKLDLNKIVRGEEPNIQLAAGDILWVPPTFGTRVEDFLNRNFFLRFGATVTYSVTGIEFMNRQDLQAGGLGGGSNSLQDSFDPFGFLLQNNALQNINTNLPP